MEFTTALNISAGGVLLATRRYLSPSTQVSLEIPAAPMPRLETLPPVVRTFQAHVVRVFNSERCYLSGLEFTEPLG